MKEHCGFKRCKDRRSEYLTQWFVFKCKLLILTPGFITSFTIKKASAENVLSFRAFWFIGTESLLTFVSLHNPTFKQSKYLVRSRKEPLFKPV